MASRAGGLSMPGLARSDEAKAAGIGMGAPLCKAQHMVEEHGAAVYSSTYGLYGGDAREGGEPPRVGFARPVTQLDRTIRHNNSQAASPQLAIEYPVNPTIKFEP